MIGQVISTTGRKYNVIIMAAGGGLRMGSQSEHIPKALTRIGDKRAIDYIMEAHLPVAHKFIVATGWHGDLLESYVKGRMAGVPVEFCKQSASLLSTNAITAMLSLDHADSRHPTIITFCDLFVGGMCVDDDMLFVADANTEGSVGSFRHFAVAANAANTEWCGRILSPPLPQPPSYQPEQYVQLAGGIAGYFIFSSTVKLKECAYSQGFTMRDVTENIACEYAKARPMAIHHLTTLMEFGTEPDLARLRELWEAA